MLGALGVVYGDIGTSPALRAEGVLRPAAARASRPTPANVLGVLSLVFWSLTLVDRRQVPDLHHARRQQGRGRHPRAARARRPRSRGERTRPRRSLVLLGLFGAALLYGDGMITPAISVLGAVEGLEVATHRARAARRARSRSRSSSALFLVQQRGTGGIGAVFGPVDAASGSSTIAALGAALDRRAARACSRAVEPAARASTFFAAQRRARLPRARLGRPRASPAARRSTPTWATSARGPIRIAWYARRAARRCCSTTSARARCCSSEPAAARRTRSTRWCRRAAALPAGRARDGGRGHRVAGADLRRVLAHAAGGAARLLPARHDRPHLGRDRGPDLHPRGQLGC